MVGLNGSDKAASPDVWALPDEALSRGCFSSKLHPRAL